MLEIIRFGMLLHKAGRFPATLLLGFAPIFNLGKCSPISIPSFK